MAETDRLMELEMSSIWPIVLFDQFLDVFVLAHPGKTALRSVNALAARKL
jgi:hypothetical protein